MIGHPPSTSGRSLSRSGLSRARPGMDPLVDKGVLLIAGREFPEVARQVRAAGEGQARELAGQLEVALRQLPCGSGARVEPRPSLASDSAAPSLY